ncbi:hypothetical protein V8C42DRAFT_223191 [Trichoderma barbatum]
MNSTIKKSGDARRKTYAACHFTVMKVSCEETHQVTKKRKRGSTGSQTSPYLHRSPFEPCGKFRTCQTLDRGYFITPSKEWSHMTHCKEFIHDVHKISKQRFSSAWVARILEIKKSDSNHVYALVCWMYSPDDLPPNTIDGESLYQGGSIITVRTS